MAHLKGLYYSSSCEAIQKHRHDHTTYYVCISIYAFYGKLIWVEHVFVFTFYIDVLQLLQFQIIKAVARKRIDDILDGKKRIDTGIARVDAEANQSTEERIKTSKKRRQTRSRPQSAPLQRTIDSAPVRIPTNNVST